MTSVGELMHGAVRADSLRLSGGSFAEARFGAVRGRVARRRAARSAGVGGASVLGVGVLAVGAAQVTSGSFGFGGPGPSTAVVCTTAAPTAAEWIALKYEPGAEPGSLEPTRTERDGLTVTHDLPTISVTDHATGKTTLIEVLDEGVTVRVRAGGQESDVRPEADGTYTVRVSGERSVALRITLAAGVPRSGGNQTADYRMPQIEIAIRATDSHAVTCVTVSPAPTQSPFPSSSAVPSATPASTSPTSSVAMGDTPFQCGYVFASDESGTDALRVFGAPTTASAIHKVFEQWYGDQSPTTEVGETEAIAYHASLGSAEITGASSNRDPASHESLQTSKDYDMSSLGFTFVAVRDGVLVGTAVPQDDGSTPGMLADREDTAAPEEAFLWDLDALTPCGTTSVDGARIYAVAGFGQDGDFTYAWKDVSK